MRAAHCGNIIDSFEEVYVTRQRRDRRGSEVRHACYSDCRSNVVVNRRIQTTVCKLEPRLVQGAAAEGCDVADLHCLIGIVQSGAATHGVQPADTPRIYGIDVVKTVTGAQQIPSINEV